MTTGVPALGAGSAAPRVIGSALPRVIVARSAWQAIFGEVERFALRGLLQHGAPFEAIVYPLGAMVPRGELFSPVELVGVADIAALVIADAALPPDEAKAFSSMNCHFEGGSPEELARLNLAFNQAIDERIARAPRLAVLSKLHSHPFSGGNFLSGGDLAKNVFASGAVAWRERRGLSTALLHVVYPSCTPSLDAQGQLADSGWQLASWGSLPTGAMAPLGAAEIVEDDDPLVRIALSPPYYATPIGAAWCDAQKQALREAGFSPSRNVLGRGWRRYLIGLGGRDLLIALPPDLPRRPPRVLQVLDAARNLFEVLPLPAKLRKASTLEAFDLVALCRYYGRARRVGPRTKQPPAALPA